MASVVRRFGDTCQYIFWGLVIFCGAGFFCAELGSLVGRGVVKGLSQMPKWLAEPFLVTALHERMRPQTGKTGEQCQKGGGKGRKDRQNTEEEEVEEEVRRRRRRRRRKRRRRRRRRRRRYWRRRKRRK